MTDSQPSKRGKWKFWVDRGGTFTDIVACSPTGVIQVDKLLSENPKLYRDAVSHGIRSILSRSKVGVEQIAETRLGTTVATNALLERTGARTALLISAGFHDLLEIGYQSRPQLFALEIIKPPPLHKWVGEIHERVSASGELIQTLDRKKAESTIKALASRGISSLAVCLLHATKFPQHELALEDIARRNGFTQISLSHQVSALPGLIRRAQTCILDAYLTPVLQRHTQTLKAELGGVEIAIMQNHGGMVNAATARGKDAVLSGPAGGVTALAACQDLIGSDKVIGFDMGGTSTDVCLINGSPAQTNNIEIDGLAFDLPAFQIHTVAAGGGSIIKYDGERILTGPESAAAQPGPACYGLGGPATITDCNLVLGRIRADSFPKLFGASRDQAINLTASRQAITKIAALMPAGHREITEIAAGAIRIAVNKMVNAVKEISTRQGLDCRAFTLSSYGGAGGQFACFIAQELGIQKAYVHPLCSVLSALGMGYAKDTSVREFPANEHFTAATLERLVSHIKSLLKPPPDGPQHGGVKRLFSVFVRVKGTQMSLPLEKASFADMNSDFAQQYRQRYGTTPNPEQLWIDKIQLRTVQPRSLPDLTLDPCLASHHTTLATHPVWFEGRWQDTPFFSRPQMACNVALQGPAIIVDATTTILLPPGWQCNKDAYGGLQLVQTRRSALARVSTRSDPFTLEIFNHLFMHVARQMGLVLENTAASINIRERLDYSCAVFDQLGGLIANAPHMPVHLGSMSTTVQALITSHRHSLKPGDMYLTNDPYHGGTHLPDLTLIAPVYRNNELTSFVACRAHHADIGGISFGSMPPFSKTLADEGCVFDFLLVLRDGQLMQDEFLAVLRDQATPARNPAQNLHDLRAQIAANLNGMASLEELLTQYTDDVVLAYMGHVKSHAEKAVGRLIATLNNCKFRSDSDQGHRICVSITLDKDKTTLTVDFSGSSAQTADNFNAPAAITRAAVLYAIRLMVEEDIPLNDGCLVPVNLIIPDASILDPRAPAAVVAGNVETSQMIVDALLGAFGVQAACQGTMNNLSFGNQDYQYYETLGGGSGAGKGFHGGDAVHTHMTNSRLTDPEILEARLPIRVIRLQIRQHSGGTGRWHGGNGLIRELEFLQPVQVSILSNRRKIAPFGLAGGCDGQTGKTMLLRSDQTIVELASCDQRQLAIGDRITIFTPGGGGFGKSKGIR